MTAALLDTSVLISAGSALETLPESSAISVVTLGELHAGVHLARTDEARRLRQGRLDAVRRAFAPIPVDEPIAERFGEVLALARREGRTVKATDVFIVATALSTSRALATLDEAQANLARAAGAALT
ncbi:type II toxin-antitoxin system VapC family toxin [Gaiella sp.]|uniref:type II toxin-antitoxin system VapC family toxin n=1 Tax=Gaiella sp. TaxID=2663207 RepID=UPI002E33C197|nr:type II toxin-antitoxin system VapC family toxin [Gaiella sp.]HEX5584642.1 type II toxin-antitoxin system VapC family toxin [Gaiella sp.]